MNDRAHSNKARTYWWMAGCAFLMLAFLLPAIAYGPRLGFYKELLVAPALICWLLCVDLKRIHIFTALAVWLCLVAWLQYALGLIVFRSDALMPSVYLIIFALACEAGTWATRASDKDPAVNWDGLLNIFWGALAAASLFSAVIAFRQWLGMADSIFEMPVTRTRPYANLAQPNHLASLLSLGGCGLLFLQQRRKLPGWLALMACLVLLAALALTLSRTAWIFIGVAFFYLLWRIKTNDLRLPNWLPFVLLAFFVTCVLSVEPMAQWLGLQTVDLADRASAGGRLTLWADIISAIWQGPWYGYGWGQVGHAQLAGSMAEYGLRSNYSHNVLLDILVWLGPWLGGAVILLSIVWLWRLFWRSSGQDSAVAWLAFSALALHSLLEYPFAFSYFLVTGGIILGQLAGERVKPVLLLGRKCGLWLKSALVALLLSGSAMLFHDYQLISQSYYNETLRQAGIQGLPRVELNRVQLLTRLQAQQKVRRLPYNKRLSDADMQLIEKVAGRDLSVKNLLRQAKAHAWRKESEQVCVALDMIKAIYGNDIHEMAKNVLTETVLLQC